jgi:hypothetical protein
MSQKEESFEIQIVVPKNPEAQGAPTEEPEQQQINDDDNEDDDDEEYSPLSDSKGEKLYCDAEEFDSFGIEALIPIDRLQALLVHLGITTSPKYRIK